MKISESLEQIDAIKSNRISLNRRSLMEKLVSLSGIYRSRFLSILVVA